MTNRTQIRSWTVRGRTSAATSVLVALVFALTLPLSAQTFTVLYKFTGNSDGQNPLGGVVLDAAGDVYGTTLTGGVSDPCGTIGPGCGTVFKLDPRDNNIVLHRFTGEPNDGATPDAGLAMDKDGNLYGTTEGGAFGYGTVFKLDKHGNFTILHSFASTDGARPYSGVVQDAAGNLYGTTYYGGNLATCNPPLGCGVVFKITP
jgi:uncharacterized repeat protein (TIGR03803 family)